MPWRCRNTEVRDTHLETVESGVNTISVIRETQNLLPERTFWAPGSVVEVRYPTNLRIFDRMGELAHRLEPLFERVNLSPQSHLDLIQGEGDRPSAIRPESMILFQGPSEDSSLFLERVSGTWALFSELVSEVEVLRLGVRSALIVAFETVEEAVSTFKDRFFNYYSGFFEGLGKPTEVQAVVRLEQYAVWAGVPLDLRIMVTPIHVLPDLKEAIGETRYSGALLFDIDRYATGPFPADVTSPLSAFAYAMGVSVARTVADRLLGMSSESREVS